MDLSDGLADGLRQIATASDVGIVVDESAIPFVAGAAEFDSDDYELLFTAAPEASERIGTLAAELALPITAIGTIDGGKQVRLLDANGQPVSVESAGYRHF
jgi:thiamine-monophosphate kinase